MLPVLKKSIYDTLETRQKWRKKTVGLIRKRVEYRLESIGKIPTEIHHDKIEEDILNEMETEDPDDIETKIAESKMNLRIKHGLEDSF